MDELEKLYKAVSAQFDIGDFETFKSKMTTPDQRRSFYDKVGAQGFDLGDYNTYESRLGKPTEVSAQGSAPTSQTSVEPGQNVQLPTDTQPQQTGTSSLPSLAGQINQANKIAGEYGLQQGESYEIENIPGYETLVGRVDAQGRLLNPVRVNEETGEMQNIIQPVDLAPTREEVVAQNEAIKVAEMGAGEKALNSIQNMWTHIKGVPAKAAILFDQNARFDASRFLTLYGVTNLAGTDPNKLRNDAYQYLDELGAEMKQTGSIVDGLRNNDIGELASGIFNATTSLLSSMAIGATSGGAGTVLDMVGGGVYDYNTKKAEELGITTEELFKQGKGDDIAPYIINSAAAGLERIGFNGVTAAINRNLTGSAARKAGLFAFDSSKEAGTEWVQEGLSAYNEVIASGGTHEQAIEAMGQTMASDRGIEAALGGFFGATAAAGGGRAIKGLVGKSAKQKATTAQETIQQISQDYVNNPDPVIRQTLIDAAVDASDQMLEATNESKKALEGLTPENREKVVDAQLSIDQIDETIANGNLSDATVKALEERKSNIESEIDQTIKENEAIKSESNQEISEVSAQGSEVSPVGEQAQQTEGLVNEGASQEVIEPTAAVGPQNQNVATEQNEVNTESISAPVASSEQVVEQEQIVEPTASIEATEQNVNAQESTVQENEQTPVREEVVEESAPRSEMPPREQTNPRLKSLLKALPRQDVEAMRGPANVGYRQDVIEAVTGKRPTKKDAGINNVKSVLNKYFGLENAGSEASSNDMIRNWANFERTEFSNPDEAVRYQAENTDDPNEVLRLYSQEQPVFNERELRISEYLGEGKINLKDYQQYGDTNNLDDNIIKNRIDGSNKGIDLDVAAQELSDQLGYEITPDEIVEFVTNNPTPEAYAESTKSDSQRLLEKRYKELTGRSLTPKEMERFEARQARSVTDADLLSQDIDMVERGITPQQVQDRQQMEASEGLSPVQAPLPKSLLKGVSDRLKLTGLAKSVKFMSSKEIELDLSSRGLVQFQTDNVGTFDSKSNDIRYQKQDEKNLVVLHNISEKNLLRTLSFGQLPAPSLAISNVNNRFDSYGEITLVAHNSSIDPSLDRKNKVYSADAYTPRYPSVTYKLDQKRFDKAVSSYTEGMPNSIRSTVEYSIIDKVEDQGIDGLIENNAAKIAYVYSINPDILVYEKTSDIASKEATDYIKGLSIYDYLDVKDNDDVKRKITEFYVKEKLDEGANPEIFEPGNGLVDDDGILNSNLLRKQVNEITNSLRDNGKVKYFDTSNAARDYISKNNLQSDFEKKMSDLYNELSPEELLFKGWSGSGKKSFVKNNPENALKLMKRDGFIGTENFHSGSAGAARARVAPRFKNISDIQKKRGSLVSKDDFKNLAEEISDTYMSVADNLLNNYSRFSGVSYDDFSQEISDLAKKGESPSFKKLSSVDQKSVKDLVSLLQDAPTEYFEAKPERLVSVNEFKAAVVPKWADDSVLTKLSESGITVYEYDNDTKTREQAVKEAGLDLDLLFQKGSSVNGYVDQDGNIVINQDTAGLDTPIHEFSHIWERVIEKENPELHARGIELIQSPEGKPYVDHVRQTQPNLEGRELYKEALAQAIGDSGARLISSQQRSVIKEWLKAAWDYIATRTGISGMSADQVSRLSLREYTDAVAVDLLSGKPYVRMPNNDILMKVPENVTNESQLNEKQKFMSDFMLRMKAKNGVSFQGFIDGSLSAQDFKDLITFFRYSAEDGQINSIQDARDAAKAMGINSPAEVDMAYKLSKVAPEGATGIKKALVPEDVLKNTDFAKMSDEEYRDLGKQLVDSGQVVPQTLVDNIISQPRALQPWEVTALQYYRTQIDSEMATISETIDSADISVVDSYSFDVTDGDRIFGYQALAAKAEVLNKRLFDLQVVMLATANQQSAAFRLRSLMSDKDFNIVSYLAEMKAAGYVNPKLEAKLKALSDELNAVRAKLRAKERTADNKIQEIEEGNINEESKKTAPKVKNKKETISAVNAVLDSIDVNSFGLPGMSFQTNGVIRFQTSPNTSVSSAVSQAISKMKDNVSGNKMSVSDAIEQAIQDINNTVGEGNWDSMKFRSTVANQLVQQSVPVKIKKPYVNSNGVLVIPGEYIKDLARNGNNTIDKMVEAASSELGGSFSEYDIRNAISGYGRNSAKNRSDLDKDISYAKRVARLLSQIEDLETKGARLKTAKQVYENNAEINALKDQIKTLEYNIEMTPEERAQLAELKYNEGRRKYLNNYISQVQDRIDAKDFAPKRRQNKYEDDPETKALRVEAEKIKNKFKAEKYRHELENRSKAEKYGQLAYEIAFNITRGLSAGADLSAIGVQGAIFTAARPKDAFKVFKEAGTKMWTEDQYEQYFAELQAEPYYDLARRAGLNLQLPNFYQSVQEEQFKGSLPAWALDTFLLNPLSWGFAKISGKKVKAVQQFSQDSLNAFRVADRNYSLVLSQARMNLFKEFLNNQIVKRGVDVKMDEKVVQQIANEVNTITMASKVPGLQGKTANDIMSALMFSARKFVSTWKILGAGLHLLAGPNRNVQLFKDAYGGIVGRGLGTLFTASVLPTAIGAMVKYMSDDDEEDDPYFYNPNFFNAKHSDFMKIKLGDTRISLFQGIDGNVVFLARQISGEYMTSSSKAVRPLNGSGTNKTRWELFLDYMINKAAPTTSITIKALGDDRSRQESVDRISESLAPMWLSGISEQYEKSGNIFETSMLGALGTLGLSYNNYGGAEFAQKRGTDNKKAQEIFNASGLSAYDPGVGQRSYFDGKDLAKVRGKVYEEKYLPNYQEFMTEAVISNGRKLDKSINWEVKEGVVDQLKKESYKYAEIKSSGVYATTTNFAKFSFDGTQYRLLKSQYPLKAKYIADFMKSDYKEYVEEARDEVSYKLEQEGIQGTPKYRKMLEDLYIYNIANKEANQRLFEDMESGKIKLIKSAEYYSDLDKEESND